MDCYRYCDPPQEKLINRKKRCKSDDKLLVTIKQANFKEREQTFLQYSITHGKETCTNWVDKQFHLFKCDSSEMKTTHPICVCLHMCALTCHICLH